MRGVCRCRAASTLCSWWLDGVSAPHRRRRCRAHARAHTHTPHRIRHRLVGCSCAATPHRTAGLERGSSCCTTPDLSCGAAVSGMHCPAQVSRAHTPRRCRRPHHSGMANPSSPVIIRATVACRGTHSQPPARFQRRDVAAATVAPGAVATPQRPQRQSCGDRRHNSAASTWPQSSTGLAQLILHLIEQGQLPNHELHGAPNISPYAAHTLPRKHRRAPTKGQPAGTLVDGDVMGAVCLASSGTPARSYCCSVSPHVCGALSASNGSLPQ